LSKRADFLNSVINAGDITMTDANADVPMADACPLPDDRKVGDPNLPEVKEKVNQELLKQVMEMGFNEVKAENALYKTDSASLEQIGSPNTRKTPTSIFHC